MKSSLSSRVQMTVHRTEREPVREHFTPRQWSTNDDAADYLGSLMQRVAQNSLHEMDVLMAELHSRREELLHESARVQKELLQYAKLSQLTLDSTRVINERLSSFRKGVDIPAINERESADISDRGYSGQAEADTSKQSSDGTLGREAEPTAA